MRRVRLWRLDCGGDDLEECQAGRVHSASCGKDDGLNLRTVASGLALEGRVEEGIDRVVNRPSWWCR